MKYRSFLVAVILALFVFACTVSLQAGERTGLIEKVWTKVELKVTQIYILIIGEKGDLQVIQDEPIPLPPFPPPPPPD